MMKILTLLTIFLMTNVAVSQDATKNIIMKIQNNKDVLIHVHADWCPSCKVQKKILDGINLKGLKLIEVNFDKDKRFLKENKIFQQSMLIIFNNGVERKRIFGITKKEKIMTFINDNSEYSLQSEIDERRKGSNIPDDARMTMEQATEKLRKSGIISKAKKSGDQYVDFVLPNINNKQIKLSERLKEAPVVLTFYRGGWCPYCNLQLKAYQDHLSAFKEAGGQLIAISPETMDSATSTVKKHEIKYEILSDDKNKIARQYGLVFKLGEDLKEVYLRFGLDVAKNQGNDSWELPIPATYVISKEGKIVYSFLNVDYVQRAEPSDIIKALKQLKND